MKLSDKIMTLRKKNGMSQEELAEKLKVSRQTVSRWEMETAKPDAEHILRISKLFCVTADYLLNDEYEDDNDLPKVKEAKAGSSQQILFYLVALEVMILLIQFMTTVILQNIFFAVLGFLLFACPIIGFEYSYRKADTQRNELVIAFRKRFYMISTWLGLYFPIRFLVILVLSMWPRPWPVLVSECVVIAIYMAMSLMVSLTIEKQSIKK